MIVNQTTLCDADFDYISKIQSKQLPFLIFRILVGIESVLWIVASVLKLYLYQIEQNGSVYDIAGKLLICLINCVTLLIAVYPQPFISFFWRYSTKNSLSRTYTVEADGIRIQYSFQDNEINKISFAKAVGYYGTENAVYLRFSAKKKQSVYMCFHNDGYSEGSRGELLSLLQSRGIPML
jgi:hypothetical protein